MQQQLHVVEIHHMAYFVVVGWLEGPTIIAVWGLVGERGHVSTSPVSGLSFTNSSPSSILLFPILC